MENKKEQMNLSVLMDRKEFLNRLAVKIGIEKSSVENYFLTDNFPKKHNEIIKKCYSEQLESDKKKRLIDVEMWEKVKFFK